MGADRNMSPLGRVQLRLVGSNVCGCAVSIFLSLVRIYSEG